MKTPKSSTVAPPERAISSRNVVPTGTQNDFPSLTAPVTERNFSVTGTSRSAKLTLYSVSTLFTTQPTCGGHPAASGLRGEQRGDAVQRQLGRTRRSGYREVPLGDGSGQRGEVVLGSGGHDVPRTDRALGRRDGGRFRGLHQRPDDGHANLRSGRCRDQDDGRADSAAARSLSFDAQDAAGFGDGAHREIGLRPVQLLHGVLPALPAGLRCAAAQGDAQSRIYTDGRRHMESVVRIVLRVRAVHAVRVSRGPVSQRSLRSGQAGSARGGPQVRAAGSGGGAPDEGMPARAAVAIAPPFAGGRV